MAADQGRERRLNGARSLVRVFPRLRLAAQHGSEQDLTLSIAGHCEPVAGPDPRTSKVDPALIIRGDYLDWSHVGQYRRGRHSEKRNG